MVLNNFQKLICHKNEPTKLLITGVKQRRTCLIFKSGDKILYIHVAAKKKHIWVSSRKKKRIHSLSLERERERERVFARNECKQL